MNLVQQLTTGPLLQVDADGRRNIDRSPQEAAVLSLLPGDRQEIIKRSGWSPKVVDLILKKLTQRGQVVRTVRTSNRGRRYHYDYA